MKTLVLTLTGLLLIPAIASADICSDIETQYMAQISQLEQTANDAIAQTSDPLLQDAIWTSFLSQQAVLLAQMNAILESSNCNTGDVVNDPGGDGGTSGGDGGTGGTDGDDGDTGGGDGDVVDNPDGDTGTDDAGCRELMASIKAEAHQLAAADGRGFSAGAKYVRSRKAEIVAKCGNFGKGRRHVGGHHPGSGHKLARGGGDTSLDNCGFDRGHKKGQGKAHRGRGKGLGRR